MGVATEAPTRLSKRAFVAKNETKRRAPLRVDSTAQNPRVTRINGNRIEEIGHPFLELFIASMKNGVMKQEK